MRASFCRLRRCAAGAALLVASLAGCASSHHLVPLRTEVQAEGDATVRLVRVSRAGDTIVFEVENHGAAPLLVDRDAIRLETIGASLPRQRGGASHGYVVPPGGSHRVNLRYSVGLLRPGTEARVTFEDALLVNGQPLAVPPFDISIID